MGPQNWRNRGQITLLGPLRLKCKPNMWWWVHLTSQPAESCRTVVIGLVGTPFGPSGTSRDPKRGILGQKRAFEDPWLQQKNHTRSKCVVTMSPAQLDYPMAVVPKSGPPGLPQDLRGPQNGFLGQIGSFGAPMVTKKALGWANKTYYYVFYMWEVFWGPLDPFRTSPGTLVNFSQWGCELDQ